MTAAATLERPTMQELPTAYLLHDLASDEQARRSAEQLIRPLGRLAVDHASNEADVSDSAYPTLMEAIRCAALGDPEARRVVCANVLRDVMERSIKAGIVMKPHLDIDPWGRIVQHGQLMEDVFRNAWQYAAHGWQMRERTMCEIYNGFAIQEALALLDEGQSIVTFSCAPDNMTEAEAEQVGFFPDTMTCAIQVIGRDETGRLFEESAFVAGRSEPGAVRHDFAAVRDVGRQLGVSFDGLSAADILASPIVISNTSIPRGVIDIVAMYDNVHGTFFGQSKPRQDYETYLQECQRREQELAPTVEHIVARLVADAHTFHEPLDATRRLHEYSQRALVDRAFSDLSIDPRVFGRDAAAHIIFGRQLLAEGNYEAAARAREAAQQTAKSFSCPADAYAAEVAQARANGGSGRDENGDCDFISKKCPLCGAKNVRTRITKTHIFGSCGCVKRKAA